MTAPGTAAAEGEPHAPITVGRRLAVTASEDCARFSLRLGPEAREAAGRAIGLELPGRIGGLAAADGRAALCLGPDEWSIRAPLGEAEAVRGALADLGAPHSLVDVGHREVGIEVRGPAAEWALNAVCPLDLPAMPGGSGTRTVLDRVTAVLVKHAADHYRVEVWRSFAPHIWGLLEAVSREVALDI